MVVKKVWKVLQGLDCRFYRSSTRFDGFCRVLTGSPGCVKVLKNSRMSKKLSRINKVSTKHQPCSSMSMKVAQFWKTS